MPVMLREDLRRERRIEWLIVLKAVVRSRRMRMLRWPESEEKIVHDFEECCFGENGSQI